MINRSFFTSSWCFRQLLALVFSSRSPLLVCQLVLFFAPYCLLSTFAAVLRAQLQAFLEVTGNVSDGCEAGSAMKGTWLVFVSTMIPRASKCWRIVMFGRADSVLVVQAPSDWRRLLMIQDWTCWKSRFLTPLLHCCSTSIYQSIWKMLQFWCRPL